MDKQIYGIVGSPVEHSLSPAMQNAAFYHLKINAEYRLFEVSADDLERFLDNIRLEKNISGLNVTIPHKIKAKEYLERKGSLDEHSLVLGAVNTIKVSGDGSLRGFNTDGPGFYRSLVEDLKFEPEGRNIFVLGAGGAAKAIVMYLGAGPKSISVFDVDKKKAGELKSHYGKYFDEGKLNIISDAREIGSALAKNDLFVNATPVGMNESDPSPIPKSLIRPGLAVYDLVYNRAYTQLVKDANAAKAHALTGLGMLLYQGAASFEIWTGELPPVAVMRRALKEALTKRGALR
ncbi:MAG: shikimate dehydrogenase [Candidatus Omnitrophica bacterium]|nr:shikimate dehydrogenase [Candidatus Omnitrophota bacterium]MBU0881078.1 shikimate dehydrogenase [Candidatus Omnitrophota bacterium]MBU0895062.1 shikimate dehydrogenase [Candidatus Omnitrophota bacterium]MBU1809499.1 shikimate dehydrogenase [Candidatus Omnitrophota bacterium]